MRTPFQRPVWGALISLCAGSHLLAQASVDANSAYQYSLQFAVPASPAFKLVEVNSSAILRPTSFQQLTSTFGSLGLGSGTLQLPKELGFELAPFFLAFGQRLSLAQYARHAGLYRFRVSGAMKRGTEAAGPMDLALGFRFAPMDETDPRTNPSFLNQVTGFTKRINDICSREADRAPPNPDEQPGVVKDCADPRHHEERLVQRVAAATDSARRETAQQELDRFRLHKDSVAVELRALNTQLERIKQSWADTAWNKSGLEFAIAAAAHTADSLGNQPTFRALSGWLSNATQLGTWGQLVSGLNVTTSRDTITSAVRTSGTAGFAAYIGGDKYKGFVELQGSMREDAKHGGALANAGAEIFLAPGLWGQASAGWTLAANADGGKLFSKFTVRTKFPFKTPSAPVAGTLPSQ